MIKPGELETLRAKIAAMEMALKGSADQRETALRQLEDATVEMLRLQADNQRLSESIIANSATYESERFALKSEIDDLREALEKIANNFEHSPANEWGEVCGEMITVAREALAAHVPVAGEKP